MYKKNRLQNGIRVVTHPIRGRESIALGFWIGVGGRYEEGRLKGSAHFLEHILFKGSRKYSCEAIKRRIEGVGGTLNAFTSEEQTCFYAKIPSKHLNQTFDVLSDMVLAPKISARDVNREKTVIVEEIKMYHDLPQYHVIELLGELLWPDHPLGRSLAGTQETVMGLTNRDLKKFHKTHYVAENIVVAACGNVRHEHMLDLTRKALAGCLRSPKKGYRGVDGIQTAPRTRFLAKQTEQMHLAIGIPGYDEWHKDRYVLKLLNVILGGNMSSRLFVEIREKRGLAYSISSHYKVHHDTGMFIIRAGLDNHRIVEAASLILKELDKIKRYGVGKDEFIRSRDYYLGQLLLNLEDTTEHMLWIGESVIAKDRTKTLNSIIKTFNKITQEDIRRVAQDVLHPGRYNLALVGPVSSTQQKQLNDFLGMGNSR